MTLLQPGVLLWLDLQLKLTKTAMRAFTLCLPPSGCAAILRLCSWLRGAPVLASQAASRSTKTHRTDEAILLGDLICCQLYLSTYFCKYVNVLASYLMFAQTLPGASADVPEGAAWLR